MTGLVSDVGILGGRAVRSWTRNPASIAGAIVFPLVFFAMFNLVMRRIMTARGFEYAQLLPATVIVQAMFFVGMSSAYNVASDRLTGLMQRLRAMPVHRAAPIAARSIGDVSRAVVSVVVLAAIGVLAGMRFRAGALAAIAFGVVPLVFAVVVALGLGLLGYVAGSPDAAVSMASIPYLPLIMLSNGFAPADDFPGWLQEFVRHSPVSRTIDLLRSLASGGPIAARVWPWALWMAGLLVVFVALAARAFGRAGTR